MAARHLRIRVSNAGGVVADLTFPAGAVATLGDLVPDAVAARLRAGGLDPAAVGDRAAAAGFPPGELFAQDDGAGKQVRVWLE
jgi:hypothetical protein